MQPAVTARSTAGAGTMSAAFISENTALDLATVVAIDFIYAIATLALISLGLAIVFGMMRIINLAHGEFMVMGSYSAAVAVHHHVNIWIAILVVPPLAVAIIGAVIERLDHPPSLRPHGRDHAGDLGLEPLYRRRS